MFLVVFAIISAVLRKSKSTQFFVVPAIMFMLIFSLAGRSYGEQGISSFAETPTMLTTYYGRYKVADGVLNLFEGAFSSTEMFGRRSRASSLKYQILSFSPLPSFIDGFDEIRTANLHKLGRYAPPSAILEAWSFGWPFVIFLVLTQVIAGRLAVNMMGRANTLIAVSANVLMAFATYAEFTYPVRTIYRFFLLALILGILGTLTRGPSAQPAGTSRGPRPGLPKPSRLLPVAMDT
jgi:hypothetical protein